MKIEGMKVLVTGGNRGIGLALAQAFAAAGAKVWVGARDPKSVPASQGVTALALDLSSREKTEASIPELQALEFDILVNNAGQLTGGLLEEQPLADIYEMFQVNLVGLVHLTRALLPGMLSRRRGKIINNASVVGVMHFPLASTYSAAKAGVIAFSDCLQEELVGTGVSTLVMITPGVKTRMLNDIPNKYGAKIDVSFIERAISPEAWAAAVLSAVRDDRAVLQPRGLTRLGLDIARYLPPLFRAGVQRQYSRNA